MKGLSEVWPTVPGFARSAQTTQNLAALPSLGYSMKL